MAHPTTIMRQNSDQELDSTQHVPSQATSEVLLHRLAKRILKTEAFCFFFSFTTELRGSVKAQMEVGRTSLLQIRTLNSLTTGSPFRGI